MIPSIDAIVAGLVAGKYTPQQATEWLNKHVELALGDDLRDHFAGQWLMGYVASPIAADMPYSHAAKAAYEMADAMLKARTA